MSEQKPKVVSRRIPVGIVLMAVGFAIVIVIGAILLIVPVLVAKANSEPAVESAFLPDIGQEMLILPESAQIEPAATTQKRVLPTPAILPESFTIPHDSSDEGLDEGNQELPSFASYANAPKDLDLSSPEQPLRLEIPTLDIDASIERVGLKSVTKEGNEYLQWQVPDGYSVGWHESSATLGHTGNTVLNGHNNIHGSVFKELIDLKKGDLIVVHDEEKSHEYRVVETKLLPENGQPPEVRFANARWIGPSGDERITLVSCWPYTSNDNRIIVVARPTQD